MIKIVKSFTEPISVDVVWIDMNTYTMKVFGDSQWNSLGSIDPEVVKNLQDQIDSKATKEYVMDMIGDLIGGAPEAFDTLKEIADKLSDNDDVISLIINTLGQKVNKDGDKVLSTNDYTTEDKQKLSNIESGAQHNVQPDWNTTDQNSDSFIRNKPDYSNQITNAQQAGEGAQSDIDSHKNNTDIHVTPIEREQWNNKVGIPDGGTDGQVLVHNGTDAYWADVNTILPDVEEYLSYGVSWKPNVADPVLTRVGNIGYHKTLPIQSAMRGCIFNPKTKQVVYWLDEDNWKYKKGGNPDKGQPESLANLDGTDGEVFVHVPEFWIKSWDNDNERSVRISPFRINTWEHQPSVFLAAYRDTILNTVPENKGYLSTLEANTAVSIANSEAYCRGGNNNSANDADEDIFKRQLGKCRTNLSREIFRQYARKAGKEIMSYRQYKNIIYWLYVIEYANFNSQSVYNASLTAEGFHQGGLGNGLTNLSDWNNYNGNYPITPNGYTNDLGNGTGIKLIAPLGPAPVGNVYATRWRGLENPFGDIWHNVDGIIINSSSIEKNGVKFSEVYSTDNPELYGDTNYQAMDKVGEEFNGNNGYVKEWGLGETAEIIPRSNGGDSTRYKCDYHYTNVNTGLRTLLLSGGAVIGGNAGLGGFYSLSGVGTSGADVGFRTSVSQ